MNIRILLLLFRHVSVKSIAKGEIIIPIGSTKKEVFFIRKGLIRSFSTNEKSEELTFQVVYEL